MLRKIISSTNDTKGKLHDFPLEATNNNNNNNLYFFIIHSFIHSNGTGDFSLIIIYLYNILERSKKSY